MEQQRVTADEQISQQDLDEIIRCVRRDMQHVREIAQASAWTLPIHPPQAEPIHEEVRRYPGDERDLQHRVILHTETHAGDEQLECTYEQQEVPQLKAK